MLAVVFQDLILEAFPGRCADHLGGNHLWCSDPLSAVQTAVLARRPDRDLVMTGLLWAWAFAAQFPEGLAIARVTQHHRI